MPSTETDICCLVLSMLMTIAALATVASGIVSAAPSSQAGGRIRIIFSPMEKPADQESKLQIAKK